MLTTARNYLFFVTKPYSISILEPLQEFIKTETSSQIYWFLASSARKITPTGIQLLTTEEVEEYSPDAVIVPGNVVPHFWPGLKVQIFHGLGEEKRGHYRITGFFDLYCTPGPYMTSKFEELAKRQKHFMVTQTGWPKLDPLTQDIDQNILKKQFGLNLDKPVILYAPTFSPRYTSAEDLLNGISKLRKMPWQWLIKFHDLMELSIIEEYKKTESTNFFIVKTNNIIQLMQVSDLLITDTSSVAYEYLLLDRPIITYRATTRKDKGINIQNIKDLRSSIEQSLNNPGKFSEQRKFYLTDLHPFTDGCSSKRVIESIEHVLQNELHKTLGKKPLRLFSKRKICRLIED